MELYYHLSVIGTPPENAVLLNRMDRCLADLCEELANISTDEVQYIPRVLDIDSDLPSWWAQELHKYKIRTMKIPTPKELSIDGQPIAGGGKRNLVQMSDLADLVLGFWNEDPDGEELPIWETLHRSMEKQVASIWISTRDGSVYWAFNTLFEAYKKENLQKQMQFLQMPPQDDIPVSSNSLMERVMMFESKLQGRMLARKQKGLKPVPQVDDEMLQEDFHLPNHNAEEAHRRLLKEYNGHDARAMQLSELYRGSVRLRTWLPIWSTITMAFAFYADPVLSRILSGIFHLPDQFTTSLAEWLIIFGFLINAVLYMFSYDLSRNKRVQSWHTEFLHHRLLAEVLRFYLHIVPYGITLPLARTLRLSGFSLTDRHTEYVEVWNILHSASQHIPTYDEKDTEALLDQLINYIESQKQYHIKSAQRYEKVTKIWKRNWQIMFRVGFALLLIRAVAQAVLVMLGAKTMGASWVSLARSIANMAAMIVPAIATYISGKLSLTGYEESYSMDILMINRLNQALELVKSMKNRAVNYSMIRNLVEKLEILLLDDVTGWTKEMEKCKVKGL